MKGIIMGTTFIYLGVMLLVILFWFLVLKRPVYEAILVSFLTLVTITGKWGSILSYINNGMSTSLIYSMVVFVAMSILLTETKIIDGAIMIIFSLFGRLTGGAGYVSVIASSFMGALSGSGPGNVMATGAITIPAMKRSGFPAELAANIECSASCLGNMIPPSSTIVAALGVYTALYPESTVTTGQFWMVCWGCSIWFILCRLITVFSFCKYYKVKPLKKEEIPTIKETIKKGWQGLLLPLIIFVPFLLDYLFKASFFTDRLGAQGAKFMSSSLLYFIAGVASIYAVIIVKDKKSVKISKMADTFGKSIKKFVPTIATCIFGYMFGTLYSDLNLAEGLGEGIEALNMGKLGLSLFIPLLCCVLGMAIVGSTMTVVFGPVLVTLFAAAGVNPLLAAAMLPCICGVMSNITPPVAPGFLASMSLSGSEYGKTVKNDLWWMLGQYVIEVVILMGLLPIFGL